MSLDYDEEETDHLLVAVDDLEVIVESPPRPSQELLGTEETPTQDASSSTKGWHPVKGVTRNCGRERAFAKGPLSIFRL